MAGVRGVKVANEIKVKITGDSSGVIKATKEAKKEIFELTEMYDREGNRITASNVRRAKAFEDNRRALDGMAQSARATAFALRQVPAQFTDIVVSLQAGQSPMQVLLQQGGQLKDLFGGAGNAAKALGGYLLGLINPYTLAAAAIAGVGAAYFYGSEQSERLNNALIKTGGYAGVTAGELEQLVQKTGKLAGGYADARVAAELLSASGQIGGGALEQSIASTVNLATLLGISIDEAAKKIIDLSKDPLGALKKLDETMHFLTADTYKQITALIESGKQQEAVALATKTLDDVTRTRTGNMRENLGYLESAWKTVKSAIDGAKNAVLDFGRDKDPAKEFRDESIARLEKLRGQLNSGVKESVVGNFKGIKLLSDDDKVKLRAEIKAITEQLDRQQRVLSDKAQASRNKINKESAEIARFEASKAFIKAGRTDAQQLQAALSDIEKQFTASSSGLDKSSKEYQQLLDARLTQINDAKQRFAKKGKAGGASPLAASFAVGGDDLAALKQNLSQAAADLKDTLASAGKVYDEAYKQNQISLTQYYATREAIANRGADEEIAAQQKLLQALEAERGKVAGAASKNGKGDEQKRNRLADIDRQIADVNGKLLGIERERGQAVAAIARERERDLKALKDSLADIALENASASGADTTQARADAIRRRNQALLNSARANEADIPGATDTVLRKIEIEINQDTLTRTEADFNAALERMRNAEESINIQKNAGLTGEIQARNDIIELHKATAQELDALIPKLEAAAQAIGGEAVDRVKKFKNEIATVRTVTDELTQGAKNAFSSGFTQFFDDVISGAKTAGEAMTAFAAKFLKAMADILMQRAAMSVTNSLFGGFAGAAGSSSAGGIWDLFSSGWGAFHTGGVVGARPPQTVTAPAIVFNGAPRYHTGGIAGLKANEVPAILQKGEEVLTADDPRHRNNASNGGNLTIINTLDKAEVQDAAWGGGSGRKLVNAVTANRAEIKMALGI